MSKKFNGLIHGLILCLSLMGLVACGSSDKSSDSQGTIVSPPGLPGESEDYTERDLTKSWNLVSFPVTRPTKLEDLMYSDDQYANLQSIWKWDAKLNTSGGWKVFPETGTYPLLETVTPDDGYWVRTRSGFNFSGAGVDANAYSFSEGWNLIGYRHTGASMPVSQYFEQNDFWQDSCVSGETVVSAWSWNNNMWQVYFPNDADRIAFNTAHQTNFEAFTMLNPGMGIWVNAAQSNEPQPVGGCGTVGSTSEIALDATVSGVSIGNLKVFISGGSGVDYSNFSATTSVTADGEKVLEKSNQLTTAFFPSGNGVVLAYSVLAFNTVDDFNSLTFSLPLQGDVNLQIFNDSTVVAERQNASNFSARSFPARKSGSLPQGRSISLGSLLGEFTGGTSVDQIDISDAVFLVSWIQLGRINDVALIEGRAEELFSNIQGSMTTIPTTANSDFTGNQAVDINDAIYLVSWLQLGRNFNTELVEARAQELYSNIQESLLLLPGSGFIVLNKNVSGLSLSALSIRISGGNNVDYSTYSTTTTVNANGLRYLTKSNSATQTFFPNGGGVALAYDGAVFDTVSDFNSLGISGFIPEGAVVEVYNVNEKVAETYTPLQANAGKTRIGFLNKPIILTGVASIPSNGSSLEYSWSIVSTPSGSSATLTSFDLVNTNFTPDVRGDYEFQLTYSDNWIADTHTVTVEVEENPLEFVQLSAGTFTMGGIDYGNPAVSGWVGQDSIPTHEVTLTQDFEMMNHKVTTREYYECVMDEQCEKPNDRTDSNYYDHPHDLFPVNYVSWHDAVSFTNWLNSKDDSYNYRLCTEAEWEYTTRANTSTPFVCGYDWNCMVDYAFTPVDYSWGIGPVKSKLPNAWGIYDMQGLGEEWLNDWYDENYYSTISNGAIDPKGPETGELRVLRGAIRSADRSALYPNDGRQRWSGMRICRD